MDISAIVPELLKGVAYFTPGNLVMIAIGAVLIYLAIAKGYEPVLLLPIGFGCILANIPLSGMTANENVTAVSGMMSVLYRAGISTELFPLLIFIGVGAMIDFSPLLAQPRMVLLGAAGQFGIFGTLILAILLGFPLNQAASIGVIGAIDGPTSIFVASKLAPELLAPIAVAAYSYMSLIPIIQPPLMKLMTTKKERMIRMEYAPRPISQRTLVIFPVALTVVVGLLVPEATPLISMLMLGNLLKVSGVVERLSKAAENEIINIATLFLGLAVGATMTAEAFLNWDTGKIMLLGLLAFALDTVAGLLFGKLMSFLSGGKINPLIGAAGISAYPMAARVVQREGLKYNKFNFLLMHAVGANTGGQCGSVMAAAIMLSVLQGMGIIP
jgi:oxaloacetate decarboxylase beta subunit